uniref:NADH-ubiquinone oxidoreductase chain 4 n=1 Tax=Capsala katsuwoni TaxID=2904576 RepID=A0A8T9JD24_9PLAT|nr:NADH dehydrogenase subunit 4 [Capsala katsuwoni]UOK11873.1 NADH dehydrogenase subunit 4 [Capsala katsuwoni]
MKTNTYNFLVLSGSTLCWLLFISIYFLQDYFFCNDYWCVNPFTVFLSFIPVIFFSIFVNSYPGSKVSQLMLFLSMFCSVVCFNLNNTLLFWIFYELSILPLLLLLYIDSPYSERFLAIWYLLGYVMVTSLPMLWVLIYLSLLNNSFTISSFNIELGGLGVLLFLLFITKIPLPPFHSWLPVVHAEANSHVSIMLSGYIMKLGLIGVYRFNCFLFEDIYIYIILSFLFSIFFFFNSFLELDSKRWLAFLSLSHILISLVGLYCSPWWGIGVSSFYCLGHGISAGLLFYLFLYLYNGCGSRNWLVLGDLNSSSLILRVLSIVSLVTLASFPPSIQFLSEVTILINSFYWLGFVLPYSIYLFIGGLVPVLLISYFISRNSNLGNVFIYYFSFILQLVLCLSCFLWGILL